MNDDNQNDTSAEGDPNAVHSRITRLKYSQMKQVDELLAPMLRRLADGYCEYIEKGYDDNVAAAAISAKIGTPLTHANIAYIRKAEYGMLKPVSVQAQIKASALTDRMDKLEANLTTLLDTLTSPAFRSLSENGAAPPNEPGMGVRLSKVESAVSALKSRDASREQVFAETVSRINVLEGRFNDLLEATLAESSSVENRLRDKFRVTSRRDPRKR